jgi:hypothetical protein
MRIDRIELIDTDSGKIVNIPAKVVVQDLVPVQTGLLKGYQMVFRVIASHSELREVLDGLR